MRTEDLIRTLVEDHAPVRPWSAWTLLGLLLIGFLGSALLFSYQLGLRSDLPEAFREPRFALKVAVTLALAIASLALAVRLGRPGLMPGAALGALLVAPLLLLGGVAIELSVVPASDWRAVLVGENWLVCLTNVPLLAIPLLAAALIGLRMGAPTRPMLAGGIAGLIAGALAAALYAAHCTDDSPLFVAAWYSLAIALVAAAGALIGARVLRW